MPETRDLPSDFGSGSDARRDSGSSLRVASLGSGSRGNGTLIDDGRTCVLLDLGFNLKETRRRLSRLGKQPQDIDAILVTHEHGDHIRGVAAFARKHDVAVYLTSGSYNPKRLGALPSLHFINIHRPFGIGTLSIEPIPVPHDAREPCQFIIASGGSRVGVLTDIGHITPFVVESFELVDALLLEFNHDVGMLARGPYPYRLKARVGGIHGHLNNEQAAGLVERLDLARLQHLVISHVSEKNNSADLAVLAARKVLGKWPGQLHVASQDGGFPWIQLPEKARAGALGG
jgi:phosphoribosyl 1,2-cyclic phosphodiesterase